MQTKLNKPTNHPNEQATALSYAGLNRLVAALLKHGYPTLAVPPPTAPAAAPAPAAAAASAASAADAEGPQEQEPGQQEDATAAAPTAEEAAAAVQPTVTATTPLLPLLQQRWRALGADVKLKRQRHAPHLRMLARHLVASLVRAAAKQRVQERKREEAKKEAARAKAAAAAEVMAATAAAASAGAVVDLLTPPPVVAPVVEVKEDGVGAGVVQQQGAGPIPPVVPVPLEVTPEELRAECIKCVIYGTDDGLRIFFLVNLPCSSIPCGWWCLHWWESLA